MQKKTAYYTMQVRKHSVPLCKYETYLYKSLQHIEALYGKLQ